MPIPKIQNTYSKMKSRNLLLNPEYAPLKLILLPESFRRMVEALPIELLKQDEETLSTLANPSRQQRQLKISFWENYDKSLAISLQLPDERTQLDFAKIIEGVCSEGVFLAWVESLNFLAWLITPQCPENILVSELLYTGLQGLRTVLQIPMVDEEGRLMTSLVNTKLAIVKMLDARKYGNPVIKSESKVMTQNIPSPYMSGSSLQELSNEEFLERIKTLEKSILPAPK